MASSSLRRPSDLVNVTAEVYIKASSSFNVFSLLFKLCRFCCLMAGAIFSAGLLPLWPSKFCWVSWIISVIYYVDVGWLQFPAKAMCCAHSNVWKCWTEHEPAPSMMIDLCLLEFNDHEKTHMHYHLRQDVGDDQQCDRNLWCPNVNIFLLQGTKWWWWDARASTSLATSTATSVSRVHVFLC